jgi:hypothetical protein
MARSLLTPCAAHWLKAIARLATAFFLLAVPIFEINSRRRDLSRLHGKPLGFPANMLVVRGLS